jgi:hypothetical protein
MGGCVGFLLSRHVLTSYAANLSNKFTVISALAKVFEDPNRTTWLQFLVRLSPVVPYSALNYIFGALKISMRSFFISYVAASALWSLPCSYLGILSSNFAGDGKDGNEGEEGDDGGGNDNETDSENENENENYNLAVTVFSIVATVAATSVISYVVRKQIHVIIEKERVKEMGEDGDEHEHGNRDDHGDREEGGQVINIDDERL